MVSNMTPSTLKDTAKDLLAGKYGQIILITILNGFLTFFVTNVGISLTTQIAGTLNVLCNVSVDSPVIMVLSYLIAFLFTVFCNVFQIGFSLIYLRIACKQYFSSTDLFYGFQNHFCRSLGLSAVITLISVLYSAPLNLIQYIYEQTPNLSFQQLLPYLGILLVGICIYIPLSLGSSQCIYLMLDFPQYGVKKLFSTSFHLMKGKKMLLFGLQLSFLPLLLLNVLSLFFGSLWLNPYMQLTYALFFLSLMRQNRD